MALPLNGWMNGGRITSLFSMIGNQMRLAHFLADITLKSGLGLLGRGKGSIVHSYDSFARVTLSIKTSGIDH